MYSSNSQEADPLDVRTDSNQSSAALLFDLRDLAEMMQQERHSDAVVLYLGKGSTPYPKRDSQRLVDRYGSIEAADLVSYCEEILEELYATAPDWGREDLAGAAQRSVTSVASRHPELNDEALESLKWSFTWDWK